MIELEFLGPIQKPKLELEISTLKELKEFLQKDEELKDWLELCAISINEKIITDINTPLKHGDKIALLPPVSGG
ncbi:MoaD/ThiS family protein [Campylobacter sp. MIT 12-8780]|uniref:MoaD/ThiS family protein n=1 Tax=unclassified Campylobacter TaxID=2593542 RepID=UPI00051409FE|nr:MULTISPECIES: MoaD/ThiS family protein [unclassified Campylobacter]KGI56073.1 molybdenum cofactor biosynthesis protein MoaD [Campylobacter sp. MIT 97-5078]TQR27727.1 MoaD/ThiS family protein [Campylobacter sp. MIT 97-5078]TQR41618.1 MoaD/ThiS family protein [Campylobacter sp. MIT 12-8780]